MPLNTLLRSEEFGTKGSFAPAERDLRSLIDLWREFDIPSLDGLPAHALEIITSHAQNTVNLFQELKTHDWAAPNSNQRRQALIERVGGVNWDVFQGVSTFLVFLRTKDNARSILDLGEAVQRELTKIDEPLAEKLKQVDASIARANTAVQEAELAAEASKKAAALSGVAAHTKNFLDEANVHLRASRQWLTALLGLAAVIVVLAIASAAYYLRGAEDAINYNFLVAKIIVVSTLASVMAVCARNYRAHRHNYIVNRHRGIALASFEAFAAGSEDPSTRDAVLIAATKSVFSQQQTGYGRGEGEPDGSPQIVEIVRSVAGRTH